MPILGIRNQLGLQRVLGFSFSRVGEGQMQRALGVHGTRHFFQAWLSSAPLVPSGLRGRLLSGRNSSLPSPSSSSGVWRIAHRHLSWTYEDEESIGETWRRVKKPKKKRSSALARDRHKSIAEAGRPSKVEEVDRSVNDDKSGRNAYRSKDRPEMNDAPERPVLKKTASSRAQFRWLPPFKKRKPVYQIGRPKPAPRTRAPKPELEASKKTPKTAFKASKAPPRKSGLRS